MKTKRRVLAVGATVAVVTAAGVGGYRARRRRAAGGAPTGTADAGTVGRPSAAPGRRRRGRRRRPSLDPPPDALFDLPADVTSTTLPAADGGSIHLVERGAGRPLVLLHGITLRSDVWAPQLNVMAGNYRVIAPDLRGHGRSTAGRDGYGMPRLARDLATVLAELDLRDAVVVGHSMGGMALMQFCGDHPDVLAERVAGVVFLATRAHAVVPPLIAGVARRVGDRGQARLDAGGSWPDSAALNRRLARVAFGERPSPKAVAIVAEMTSSIGPEAVLPSGMGLLDHDAREALAGTDTPAMVVVGSRDVLTPVPASRRLAQLLQGSELHVLPAAGHQLMQERPDELAALIDDFVLRLPALTAELQASS